MRQFLTLKEVQDRLGIGRTTIYHLRRTGALPFVMIGDKPLVDEADFDAYVDSLQRHTTTVNDHGAGRPRKAAPVATLPASRKKTAARPNNRSISA